MTLEEKAEDYLKAQCLKRKDCLVLEIPDYYITDVKQAYLDGAKENTELINKMDNDEYSKFLLRQINLQTRQIEYLEIKSKNLENQIEEMKNCLNCEHYRWSNGDDWCNDHYGQPTYDKECKGKWELRR